MGEDSAVAELIAGAQAFTAAGFHAFGYVESREVEIAALPNALITRRDYLDGPQKFTGAVYDGQGALVRSSLGFSEGEYTPLDPDSIAPDRRPASRALGRAVYGGTLYPVLGHFLFETVARLWHGVDLPARRGRLPVVFHPWPDADLPTIFGNPFYRQVLAALGIARQDVLLADVDLQVETLYCPSPLSIYHSALHPMMGFVLDHVARELTIRRGPLAAIGRRASSPRIFLSRSRWGLNRRVRNEIALEDLFAAQGFALVHPQQLAPRKLLELLQGAEIIASTDGSQAHLMAFCRPGTRALLLDTRPVPTQFAIAKLRHLHSLHLPLFENGMWDPEDGSIDLSPRTEQLLAALLTSDADAFKAPPA